jgi:hypothetical protein
MAAYLSVNERTFLKHVSEEDVLTGHHLRKPGGSDHRHCCQGRGDRGSLSVATTLPFHGPICLAEEIAFTDILSRGHLRVGIGRGNRPNCERPRTQCPWCPFSKALSGTTRVRSGRFSKSMERDSGVGQGTHRLDDDSLERGLPSGI